MSRTSVTPDALTAAIAIVNALRRRQYRRETLRGIAPIVALALCVALAIGFALYVAAIDVLDAAPPPPFPSGAPPSAAAQNRSAKHGRELTPSQMRVYDEITKRLFRGVKPTEREARAPEAIKTAAIEPRR
jgi:hypothetical protein